MATAHFDFDFPLHVTLAGGRQFYAADIPIRVHLRSDIDSDDWCIDSVEVESRLPTGTDYLKLSPKDPIHVEIEASSETHKRAAEAWRLRDLPAREYEAA